MNKKLLSRFERDLQLRGLSELTQESYLNKVQKFADFIGKNPKKASAQEVKRYLHYLMKKKGLTKQTVKHYAAALKMLFTVTLQTKCIPIVRTISSDAETRGLNWFFGFCVILEFLFKVAYLRIA